MSQIVTINITTGNEPAATIQNLLLRSTTAPREESRAISEYFVAASAGDRNCSYDVQVNGGASVAASGTIAFSGVSTANDTILINGTTLTAVASGATNNQWNVKSTAALQAVEVIRAINASTTSLVSGLVVASLTSTSTVTISAVQKGIPGNAITIAKGTDAGTVMTVSGARLTGGVATSANVYHQGV